MESTDDWKSRPLIRLERRPLRCQQMQDALSRRYLCKGDEVYLFQHYAGREKVVDAALFDADPELAANKKKYEQDAYDIRDYSFIKFKIRAIRNVLATATPENLNIADLLHTAATTRNGEPPYRIAMYYGEKHTLLYEKKYRYRGDENLEVLYLLYILKKCGYMDAIFRALPELPEDFPLLLMSFADTAIRRRVEEYMGIPGLAAMYDLAFAPRHLNVKDQLKLVEFGRSNPRFQKLLGISLYRYGYHLYCPYFHVLNTNIQELHHFRAAFCSDVLLFLLSAPETLPQLRQLLNYGAAAYLDGASVAYIAFPSTAPYFNRNILGYLALNDDPRLPDWEYRKLKKEDFAADDHKRLKTAELIAALRRLPGKPSAHAARRQQRKGGGRRGDGTARNWKTWPMIRLERGLGICHNDVKNQLGSDYISWEEEACLFRLYWLSESAGLAAVAEMFDADPELVENRRKYEQDAYKLNEYRTPFARFRMPCIRDFFAADAPENPDIPALLRTAATARGGGFPWGLARDTENGQKGQPYESGDGCNLEVLHLLHILKKCGYLDAIFRALPELPEDFPLLLMCFADKAIRRRVEDYMGIPGLAAMYDLAFAPHHLDVREQIRLVTFGRDNPRFQELLGTSLYRYGYHLHDRGTPRPDWKIQDFAHFRNGFCADVLLFLVSAPDTLPPLRQLLDSGPEARVSLSDGFDDATPGFCRNILGYLALTGDTRLPDWLRCTQEDAPDAAAHKRLKTPALVTALQKLAQS